MEQQIVDRQDRKYSLSITQQGASVGFKLYNRQILVGEVRGVRESDETLLLADIAIANEVFPIPETSWISRLGTRFGYWPKPISYRKQGLGSALLKAFVDHASHDGVRHIYGKVMKQDLENNPKLLQWYQRHGFETRSPTSTDEIDILVWIYLNI
ncbi:MAG: GNAT family N-acetyltransferase [Elainellaceae cyanobacterium]